MVIIRQRTHPYTYDTHTYDGGGGGWNTFRMSYCFISRIWNTRMIIIYFMCNNILYTYMYLLYTRERLLDRLEHCRRRVVIFIVCAISFIIIIIYLLLLWLTRERQSFIFICFLFYVIDFSFFFFRLRSDLVWHRQ